MQTSLWFDKNLQNLDFREDNKLTLTNTVTVMNAAGRWRRKHRRMLAINSKNCSAVRSKSRTNSANIQSKEQLRNIS